MRAGLPYPDAGGRVVYNAITMFAKEYTCSSVEGEVYYCVMMHTLNQCCFICNQWLIVCDNCIVISCIEATCAYDDYA